jgi:hypothetical protein
MYRDPIARCSCNTEQPEQSEAQEFRVGVCRQEASGDGCELSIRMA